MVKFFEVYCKLLLELYVAAIEVKLEFDLWAIPAEEANLCGRPRLDEFLNAGIVVDFVD
jgi:hypothetical protein